MTLADLTSVDRQALMNALATREGSAADIAKWYTLTTDELKQFVHDHRVRLEELREQYTAQQAERSSEPSPTQLDDLWLTKKFERLRRYQDVAEMLYQDMIAGALMGSELATAAREFRSYAQLAANELGQLLHRGAGDVGEGDTMSIDIGGIDINALK